MTDRKNANHKADLVLENGVVYTVDKQRSFAEAVAVSGKKIVYVGSTEGVTDYIGPRTEVIDLAGKMVLPGFIDSHAHPTLGVYLTMARLFDLHSVQACVDEVVQFGANHPDLPVIYGIGWSNGDFPPEGPRKELLDAVIADRPVAQPGVLRGIRSCAGSVCPPTAADSRSRR